MKLKINFTHSQLMDKRWKEQKALLNRWRDEAAISNLFEINRRDITLLIERLLEAKDAECKEKVAREFDVAMALAEGTIPLSEHKEKMRELNQLLNEQCERQVKKVVREAILEAHFAQEMDLDKLFKKYGVDEAE